MTLANAVRVRRGERRDLDALVQLESSLPGDRLPRSGLARLLGQESVEVWVAEVDGVVVGDAVVLYRKGFYSALLYAMAVDPRYRGRGIAKLLLTAAEEGARERGVLTMRLEVQEENSAALSLYESRGYVVRGRTADYYQDQSGALRLVKRFVQGGATVLGVPYHPQSLSFTSGSAALMMAMRYHGYPLPLDDWLELTLWREATGTFVKEGAGGLSAYGVAVAALRRGFHTRVIVSGSRPPQSVARVDNGDPHAEESRIAKLAHASFERELRGLGGKVEIRDFTDSDVARAIERGDVPLALLAGLDTLDGESAPRWIVVTGFDEDHLIVHDPLLSAGVNRAENVHLMLSREAFQRAAHHESVQSPSLVLLTRWGMINRSE